MDIMTMNNQKQMKTYQSCLYSRMVEMENRISDKLLKRYMYDRTIWFLNHINKISLQSGIEQSFFPSIQVEIEFRFFLLYMYFEEKCEAGNIQIYLNRLSLICEFLSVYSPNCSSLLNLSESEIDKWGHFSEKKGQKYNRFKNFLGRVQRQLKVEYYNYLDTERLKLIVEKSKTISKDESLLTNSITQPNYFDYTSKNKQEHNMEILYVNNFWNLRDECFGDVLLPNFRNHISKESLKKIYFFHPNGIVRLEFKSLIYFIFLTAPTVAANKILNVLVNIFQPYITKEFPYNFRLSKLTSSDITIIGNHFKKIGITNYKSFLSLIKHIDNWKFVLFSLPELTAESYCQRYDNWSSTQLRNYFEIGKGESPNGNIDFSAIPDPLLKKYLKQYLVKHLIFERLSFYSTKLYFNSILKLLYFEPVESDQLLFSEYSLIKNIEKFSSKYRERAITNSKRKSFNQILNSVKMFLSYLNGNHNFSFEIEKIFPIELFFRLSFSDADCEIKFIDEKALETILLKLDTLDSPYSEIIFLAFYTGQRLSDIVSLKTSNVRVNNEEYYLFLDINKTKVESHYIPLPKEFGEYLYNFSKGIDTNYLFQNKHDYRREKLPIGSHNVRRRFRIWIKENDIRNSDGSQFSLSVHAFRHTFAVKMINSGIDFVTVSNFLAHVSPEMTLHYAKKLDSSKFKQFRSKVSPIVTSNTFLTVIEDSTVNEKLITSIYHSEKSNTLRTPYGTCFASKMNSCPYVDAPPCLTRNQGYQCSYLKIDQTYLQKYQLLKNELIVSINQANKLGRLDIIEKSEQLLDIYNKIIKDIEKELKEGDDNI